MGRRIADSRQQLGLLLWVSLSSGLAIRDLWLAAHGGGATPRWLLGAETFAFSVASLGGVAALAQPSRATKRAAAETLHVATVAAGVAAVSMHGVRLGIYVRARAMRPE